METVNRFEYEPLVIIISEDESHNSIDDDDDDEFEQIARLNAEFCAKKLPDKPFEPKGKKMSFDVLFIPLVLLDPSP